jgi:hypothetical protein
MADLRRRIVTLNAFEHLTKGVAFIGQLWDGPAPEIPGFVLLKETKHALFYERPAAGVEVVPDPDLELPEAFRPFVKRD